MSEPTTTSGVSYAISAVLAVFFGSQAPNIDPETLMGAVGGSIVFVMIENTFSIPKRMLGMFASILIGYIGAPELMTLLGIQTPGVASFIVSAFAIFVSVFVAGRIRSGDFLIFGRGKP